MVVVGGGIAGYLTAFRLAEAGQEVTLLEADRLFSGTTGRTTAKTSANQGCVYSELFERYGQRVTELYYRSQTEESDFSKSLCIGTESNATGRKGTDIFFPKTAVIR
ncbi:MAG: FAD-dependent oxidoreductase [Christensenellaceae bacterium]